MEIVQSGGVILRTTSKKHPDRQQIVLIIEGKDIKYANLPGGYIQKHERICEGTARELREETRNTVCISTNIISQLPYKDIEDYENTMRVYLTRPMNINCLAYYNSNVKHLKSDYQETSGMVRFDLTAFQTVETAIINGKEKSLCYDEKGNKHIISKRVFTALRAHGLL